MFPLSRFQARRFDISTLKLLNKTIRKGGFGSIIHLPICISMFWLTSNQNLIRTSSVPLVVFEISWFVFSSTNSTCGISSINATNSIDCSTAHRHFSVDRNICIQHTRIGSSATIWPENKYYTHSKIRGCEHIIVPQCSHIRAWSKWQWLMNWFAVSIRTFTPYCVSVK